MPRGSTPIGFTDALARRERIPQSSQIKSAQSPKLAPTVRSSTPGPRGQRSSWVFSSFQAGSCFHHPGERAAYLEAEDPVGERSPRGMGVDMAALGWGEERMHQGSNKTNSPSQKFKHLQEWDNFPPIKKKKAQFVTRSGTRCSCLSLKGSPPAGSSSEAAQRPVSTPSRLQLLSWQETDSCRVSVFPDPRSTVSCWNLDLLKPSPQTNEPDFKCQFPRGRQQMGERGSWF